jgi:diguanylate cyclase (GGDEF)-like protein
MLAAGAPLGLLLTRRYVLREGLPVREELRRDAATYAYLTASALLVLTFAGRVLGRHADRLAALSTTDVLTGLLNPRGFYPRLEHEIERSKRSAAPMSLLFIDLDRLKQLNDEHGHAAGDRALCAIARAIRRELRSFDVGARLGGDEFGLLAVGADADAAHAVADRLRTIVAEGAGEWFNDPLAVSIGVVTFDPIRDRLDDVSALTRAADSALYAAKRAGRNRAAFGTLERR